MTPLAICSLHCLGPLAADMPRHERAAVAAPFAACLLALAVPLLSLHVRGHEELMGEADAEEPVIDGALALRADVERYSTAMEDSLYNFGELAERHAPVLLAKAQKRRRWGRDAVRRAFELAGNISRVILRPDAVHGIPRLEDGVAVELGAPAACSKGYPGLNMVLAHLRRDWHSIGDGVRKALHEPVLAEAKRFLGPDTPGRVVVPGAGLGRLALELGALGFHVEAVECSNALGAAFTALVAENSPVRDLCLRAGASAWENVFGGDEGDQYRLDCPDPGVDASSLLRRARGARVVGAAAPPTTRFTVGDFEAAADGWTGPHGGGAAAVVTLFFIDTARDVVDTVSQIVALLRQGAEGGAGSRAKAVLAACDGASGAVWINAGPLSYGKPAKHPLSWEEVRAVAEAWGLQWLEERRLQDVPYSDAEAVGMYTESYTVPLSVGVVCAGEADSASVAG